MDVGLYSATTGLVANLQAQDVIANNLANINTTGYKRRLAVFQPFHAHLAEANSELMGTELDGVVIDFAPGPMNHTGQPLHLAIEGEGFFVVRGPEGELYTRNGSFRFDAERQIVDPMGRPVLGSGGELTVPDEALEVRVAEDGEVFADGTSVGKFRVVDVPKPRAFVAGPYGTFALPPTAPPATPVANARVVQGTLESSNTNAVDELVSMIATLRDYEAAQRALTSIDESYEQLIQATNKTP